MQRQLGGVSPVAENLNIFHNLVTNENSTTQLLRNLTIFPAFRQPLCARLFSEACASDIAFDNIDTQYDLGGNGCADPTVTNEKLCALVEVKVSCFRGMTDNQPTGYFEHLLAQTDALERWLVFLVPKGWVYLEALQVALDRLHDVHSNAPIHTQVVYWENVLDIIENNNLKSLSPFFEEFAKLLGARLKRKVIVLSKEEVRMLFSKEIPKALETLEELIGEIQGKSSEYRSKLSGSKSLSSGEYGIYFKDDRGHDILWFGVWMPFWKQEGHPICFGVHDKWPSAIRQAFCSTYRGETQRFEKWILGCVREEDLEKENALEIIWAQLAPILQAITRTGVVETV